MKGDADQHQTSQRLRVGLVGLVAVVGLILLASAIIGMATRSGPAGNAAATAALNLSVENGTSLGEPLAELGAAPGTVNDQVAAAP